MGALTVIQRSDSALRVNPHFHTLAPDGVYVRDAEGTLDFHPLPAPSAGEVAQVAAWTHARIVRVLERHGRSLEGAHETTRASAAVAGASSVRPRSRRGDPSGGRAEPMQ